jgi:hypothetical protein
VIPRYQKIIFVVLLFASLAMGGVLWYLLDRAHQRLLTGQDSAPTRAPQVAPAEPATLLVANDADGSLVSQVQSLPLPDDPVARSRAILGRLLDLYAAEGSTHPVQGGAASIAQVFLLPVQGSRPAPSSGAQVRPAAASHSSSGANGPLLAVVNFTSNFATSHPSGIETETLTLLSICGTLRANLPRVAEVRFLVDGQQRPTLAGHADLTRTYLTAEAAPVGGAQP